VDNSGWARKGFRIYALVCMAVVLVSARIVCLSESAKPFKGYQKKERIVLGRGMIVSADGSVLAVSLPRYTIAVDPVVFDEKNAARVAGILKLDAGELTASLEAKKRNGRRFLVLARTVNEGVASEIEKLRVGESIRGLYVNLSWRRHYPFANLCSHVVGFVGRASTRERARLLNDSAEAEGKVGVERAYDRFLVPEPGEIRGALVMQVAHPVLTRGLEGVHPPMFGHQVVLNINLWLQRVLEEELQNAIDRARARAAWGVILNPNNGAVLALASLPAFDPNDPSGASHFNSAISAQVEAGSVIKPFALAAALSAGISPSTSVDCENGFYKVGKYEITDVHPHKVLSLPQVLEVSSNIGICKLVQDTGAERFYAVLSGFGFGKKTGIDLVGEVAGRMRTPGDRRWSKYDLIANSYGHGMSITAIQLASAFAALVNGGKLYKPKVVSEIRDQWGNTVVRLEPEVVGNPISEKTSELMREFLKMVVEGEHGTGKAAKVPGIDIGGKTGTAWKIANGRYVKNKHIATFVGAFPLSRPSYVVVIVVDDPSGPVHMHYSSRVAAPVFKRVVERILLSTDVDALPRPALMIAAGSDKGEDQRSLVSRFLGQLRTVTRLRAEEKEVEGDGF